MQKRCFIFDIDGTICLGDRPFPEALSFIHHLRADGRRVVFYTNNASQSPQSCLTRLEAMGFDPREEEMVTSGDVTVSYLRAHMPGAEVYLVGTPTLEKQFAEAGIRLVPMDASRADAVVTSLDTTLTYAKLFHACRLIRDGAAFFSTHPDLVCPIDHGQVMPDSGAIVAAVRSVTGVEPHYFGKPYPDAMEEIRQRVGTDREEMCMIGDRLYTDIAFGKRSGMMAVAVLTGEATEEEISGAEGECHPDVVLKNLGEADTLLFPSETVQTESASQRE